MGFNNVILFLVVGIVMWDIFYVYKGDVVIDLGVVGDKYSDWVGKMFMIELKWYRGYGNDWLVVLWVLKGIGGVG